MPRSVKPKQSQNTPYVLVAGAAGFLGSHLVESLLLSGARVVGIDNLITGKLDNLAEFKRHPRFEFVDCDLNQDLPTDLQNQAFTHIVSTLGQDTHSLDQEATLSSMVTGSLAIKNLLDLAVSRGAVFLLTSSTSVYQGLMSSISLDHYFGSNPEQRASYSLNEAKRYAEGLAEMYAKQYNLDIRIARLSQVYGPRMDILDGNFLDLAIRQTLQGQDIIIEEEGGRELQLTYISDAVYGLSRLLFAPSDTFRQAIYPIVNPEKVSILSIAYTLRGYLPEGKDVKFLAAKTIEEAPLPALDLTRTTKDLAWEPTTNLSTGLKRTVEYFQAHPLTSYQHATPTPKQLAILPQSLSPESTTSTTPAPVSSQSTSTPNPEAPNLPHRGGPNSSKSALNSQPPSAPVARPSKPTSGRTWLLRFTLLALLVVLYFLWGQPLLRSLTASAYAGYQLKQGLAQVQDLQFQPAQQSFTQATQALATANQQWSRLEWLSQQLTSQTVYYQTKDLLQAATSTSQGLVELTQAAEPWPQQLQSLSQQMIAAQTSGQPEVTPSSSSALLEEITQSQQALRRTSQQLSRAMATLNSNPGSSQVAAASLTTQGSTPQESIGSSQSHNWLNAMQTYFRTQLAAAQLILSQTEQGLEVLPQLLGQGGSHRYLLLLQNSNEIRPTGGFTGSLVEIAMANGQLQYFKVDDIYNPDGQIIDKDSKLSIIAKEKTNTIPLRDANWYADVPTSAQKTIALYQQATGRQVDSVAYITLNAIRPLLVQAGSVYLPEFQQTVTADNFDQLAQAHSNAFYTSGVSDKKDFLAVLFTQLFSQLGQDHGPSWIDLAKVVYQGLHNQEIQLYSRQPEVASLIGQHDWAGLTKQGSGDYLRVVDANIGANKSNYYIQRSTDYQVNVDRYGHLSGVATITWKHSGQSATWPGGDFANYLRLYVPQGAQLQSAQGVDPQEITSYTEANKQVFATSITIPYNQTTTLVLRYSLPQTLDLVSTNYTYQLDWQKQSGIQTELLTIRFNTPSYLKPLSGQTTWSRQATTDQTFEATFESILKN